MSNSVLPLWFSTVSLVIDPKLTTETQRVTEDAQRKTVLPFLDATNHF